MKAKLIAIVFALILPFTAVVYAGGEKGDYQHHRAKKMERLEQELSLTADQKSQMEALFKEQKAKFKAIREETQSQMQTILTPEQYTKLEEIKQRRYEKWREKHEARKSEKSEATQ
jgi:periplasmic protein CpxP/Spy